MLVGPISMVTPVQLRAYCCSTHARSREEVKSGDEGAKLRVDLVQRVCRHVLSSARRSSQKDCVVALLRCQGADLCGRDGTRAGRCGWDGMDGGVRPT